MVGVPGRSKGCTTCKKRKKRCDLQQPQCGNCTKGNYVCGGYARSMLMVHVDDSGKGTYKPEKPGSQLKKPSARAICQGISPLDLRIKNLNRSSIEIECFNAFCEIFLPPGAELPHYYERFPFMVGSADMWIRSVRQTVPTSDLLRCGLLALSMTEVGKAKGDKRFVHKGMELYGQSLSLLSKALQSPSRKRSIEVLNCCRMLAMYEQLNDFENSAKNWQGHTKGMIDLLQLHPLESWSEPSKHELFLEMRYKVIFSAIFERKATFLASPGWITKPWNNQRKCALDTAMDIFALFPGVFEEWDTLRNLPSTPETNWRAQRLKHRLSAIHGLLQAWYEDYISIFENTFGPDDARNLRVGRDDSLKQVELPNILGRHGITPLYPMSVYWLCCMTLCAATESVFMKYPPSTPIEAGLFEKCRSAKLKHAICIASAMILIMNADAGIASMLSIPYACAGIACLLDCHRMVTETETQREDMVELKRRTKNLFGIGPTWNRSWLYGLVPMC